MGVGALVGAVFGFATGGFTLWGTTFNVFQAMMMGASIGSLFDQQSLDFGSSSPNYSFGPVTNSKSQLLPVPICYGKVRVAGNIFLQNFYSDKMEKQDMFVGLSEGPINRVVSIYVDDQVLYGDGSDTYTYWTLVSGSWVEVSYSEYQEFDGTKEICDSNDNPVTFDLNECAYTIHLGELTQPKDDRETGEYAYPGTAYVALTLKAQDGLSGNPTVTTVFEGRKVWTPSGVRFTRNPAWIVYDLLTSTRYGVGLSPDVIDLDSFEDVAVYCDALVDGTPRFTLDYIIDQQRPVIDILQDMLSCFQGYIVSRDKISLRVDQPVSSPYKALDEDNIVKGSFSWWQKAASETLNRVVVEWIDPENHYERTSTAFENQADIAARGIIEQQYSLLGVTDAAIVSRIGGYLLETAQTIRNYCSFQVSIQDADVEAGDVISITYPSFTGWSEKWFRVLSVSDAPDDNITLSCVEYKAGPYSATGGSIVTPTPDTPTPGIDNYSALILTDIGTQNADGTYVPKINVAFSLPETEMKETVITYWHDGKSKLEKKISPKITEALISEGVRTGELLTVRVWGTDINGKQRSGVIGQITPGHDDIAPGAPTSLTATGWFGEIVLDWVNPETNEDGTPCTDLAYIEVWESSEDDRETAVLVGKVNGTHFQRYLGSFAGRYYWVRAVDTSGNVSQWNAEAGVYGYSEQATHEDFINALLEQNPLIQELYDHLGEEVDGVSEERIKDILGGLDQFYLLMFQQRQAEREAEALIEEALGNYQDMKYGIAIVAEEKTLRETAEEALAQSIETVAAMLGDPNNPGADTVWAGIYSERTARVTADEAIAQQITDVSAGIGDPLNPEDGTVYAAIRKEAQARATGDESSATEIETLYSQLGTTNAAIQQESITRASQDSSLASQINTVQGQVGDNRTVIQQQATVINGIQGEWTVKIDYNGAVSGIGLINGPTGSAFIVRSDSFWVGKPGTSIKESPFVIGTVDGITKVSMSNAFIQDAAIVAAKIKDLTIGRIKMISGAPAGLSAGDSTFSSTRYDVAAGYQALMVPGTRVYTTHYERGHARTIIIGSVKAAPWESEYKIYLYRNGSNIQYMGEGGGGSYTPAITTVVHYVDDGASNGTNYYELRLVQEYGPATYIYERGLTAITIYR
jgi:hypothetical protein